MTSSRLRVLHLIQNLNYGGMERVLSDLVTHVDQARIESHILVLQYYGRFSEGLSQVARLHKASPMSRFSLLNPASLAANIRSIAPDIVHTHSGVWYKGALAARRAAVRTVIHTEHGRPVPEPRMGLLVDRLATLHTDVIVGVSDAVAAVVRERLVIGRRSRVVTIANGIDTTQYRPGACTSSLRAELGLPASTPIIGSVGRLEPIKGFDVLVSAFAHLRTVPGGPFDARLVIIGDGSQRQSLERQVADLGLTDLVHFLGWRDQIDAILPQFSAFAMSSRSEGTSISLLEAMSAGVCPVVTDVGGNAAVLGAELAHRLVPSEQPKAFASAIACVLTDGRAAADARISRTRVETHFSLARMAADYQQLYRESVDAR